VPAARTNSVPIGTIPTRRRPWRSRSRRTGGAKASNPEDSYVPPGHSADGSAVGRSRLATPGALELQRANDTLHTGSLVPKMDLADLLTKIIATPKQTEIAPLHSRHAIDAHSNRSRTRVHGRAARDNPNDSTGRKSTKAPGRSALE